MKKIEQVGDSRPEPLDLQAVDRVNMADDLLSRVAAGTRVEQTTERALVVGAFVDVGDAQFRFPEKCMVGASKDLALFRDGVDDGFK